MWWQVPMARATALALLLAGAAAQDALATALLNSVVLNSGTHTSVDNSVYLPIPCMYLEAENVTCAQCSWGIGGSCPYLFATNSTGPMPCTPGAPMPGKDQPGGDYTATPVASQPECESLCCSEQACVAWTWAPSAPSNFLGCTTGESCCYRKGSQPTPVNSTIPGIVSGTVSKPWPDDAVPPPLGLRSSVPLGGVGAGALELRGDGSIHEVTIMNASPAGAAKFGTLADMTTAVRVAAAGGGATTAAKLLRTQPLAGWSSPLPPVDSITYSGAYPLSRLAVTDADLAAAGVEASLFAFSTLEPGSSLASGVPAAVFTLVATNTGDKPLDVSFLLTLPLPAINDCARPAANATTVPASSPSACLHACATAGEHVCSSWTFNAQASTCAMASGVPWNVYSQGHACGVAGSWSAHTDVLTFSQNPLGGVGGPANGDVTLQPLLNTTTGGPATSATVGVSDSLTAILAGFAATGSAAGNASTGDFTNVAAALGAATVTVTIQPGATASLPIVFAWYFPDRDHMSQDIGNFYANVWESSEGVAQAALGTLEQVVGVAQTINAHHAVFASPMNPMPLWLQDFTINQVSHMRGMIWTKDGRMREFEAMDCPDVDSQHNDHQRHLLYLWLLPQFETDKMRKWGTSQYTDGHLPEYLGSFNLSPLDQAGGRVMADTTTIWIIELLELYLHTGDVSFLEELYPIVPGAVQWQIGASAQLGLPYELVCTYDILDLQQYPTTTFNSFLHLAAMKAAVALAGFVNDTATANSAQAAYNRGVAALQSLLWNTTYSYFRAYTTGDALMPDCMYGQMLAHEHGLGLFVNTTFLSAQLAAEVKYNANNFGFTVLTGRNTPPPLVDESRPLPGRLQNAAAATGVDYRAQAVALKQDTVDDVNWMGAAPTWSYMALAINATGGNVTAALEPTRLSVENWRSRLNDWWNIAGITTSGDWGNDNQNGQPFVTSHYGFLLPAAHLVYAITRQQTNIPGGSLAFDPVYHCPYTLPLLLAGTTGTITCNAVSGQYTVAIAFGTLNLPAGGLSIAGSVYPGAVSLSAGQSVTW